MLVTLNEILAIAQEKNCAVGAFNTPNLERLGIEGRRAEVPAMDHEIHLFILGACQNFVQAADDVGSPVLMDMEIGKYRKFYLLHTRASFLLSCLHCISFSSKSQ